MEHTNWYKDAIIYQIYPRSFCDGNGDGMGDIKGIISKLDYLKQLGVNCVWLSPIYNSPQKDNGYDISDYYNIYPPFGSMQDFDEMISEMHKRGIKLIMDLVVNHTSSEHEWFKKALAGDEKYKNYYYFKKGKNNGKNYPNNWTGFFGGTVWEKVNNTDEYYLHLFAKEQPDLNWENEEVRNEVIKILRFWLDKGVDGFRCDVITLISKKQDFKNGFPSLAICGKDSYVMGPRIHEYLKLLYDKAYVDYDCATVGETVMSSLEDVKLLTSPDRHELDMVFNFSHTDVDNYFGVKYLYRNFKLSRFRKRLSYYQNGLEGCGWNSLFIENHDQRRSIGRYGTDGSILAAKMLAATYFLLKGTPFIYQGQEIGMENPNYPSIGDYQDVEVHNLYNMTQKSFLYRLLIKKHLFDVCRDNARTPMQWDSSEYAGFSNVSPWLKVNENKDRVNAKSAIGDDNSLFNFYKKLIDLRKNYSVLKDGKYVLIDKNNPNVYSYLRKSDNEEILVISSFSKKNQKIKTDTRGYKLLLSNYNDEESFLRPYECRILYKKRGIND